MQPILIIGTSLFFCAMGFTALVRPVWVLGLFQTRVTTSEGRSEVRAVYGGYGVAISGLLLYSLTVPNLQHGIWLTVAAAMFGMAIGRVVSMTVDRHIGAIPILFLGIELVIGMILLTG